MVAVGLALTGAAERAGAEEQAPILVAAVSARGAPSQPDGADVAVGVARAVARLNAEGGLLARRVEVIDRDDGCSRPTAEAVARGVATEPVALVVGHLCSSAAIAAAPIYQAARIVMISTGARHPNLTDKRAGALIFRLAGRDDRIADDTASFIAARHPGARIAIAHDRSQQARRLADAWEKALTARKLKPVAREAIVAGEKHYNEAAGRIAAAKIDVLLLPALPIESGIIVRRLAQIGSRPLVIGGESLAVADADGLGTELGDRFVVMLPWRVGASMDKAEQAVVSDGNPSAVARSAEAAIEAWAGAVKGAGTLEASAVAQKLEAGAAVTVAGSIGFDGHGDARVPSFIPHVWRERAWRP